MPPTACVDVAALPLQLLLRRHPDWQRRPAAVISEDSPGGTVVTANRAARAAGVRAGMRYVAARSLLPRLYAATVCAEEIAAGVRLIRERLLAISPRVEWGGAGWADQGVFWMEVGGLRRHYPSPAALARTIRRRLRAARFFAAVVLGHTRLATLLLARELATPHRGAPRRRQCWLVMPAAADEWAAARRVPLAQLPLEPEARELLEKLALNTVDDFLRVPYAELLHRFGPPVAELQRAARATPELPVQGAPPAPRFLQRQRLTYRETDAGRLQRCVEVLLETLLGRLQREGRAAAELELQLLLEDGSCRRELIRPAVPTRERRRLAELLALRLHRLALNAGVEELALKARATPLPSGQSELFRTNPRRDLAAGSAALASLRAQFGNAAVARAVLAAEHLPEAQFRWQPVTELTPPRPRGAARSGQRAAPPLVRRVLAQPVEVPPPRGGSGPQPARYGPFLISTGWWRAADTAEPREGGGADRAYYFLRSPGGTLEWLYHDRLTHRWYRQGWVE